MDTRPTAITPDNLHTALARLAAKDQALADRADRVFADYRNVAPIPVLTQFYLQLYCWRYLPEHRADPAERWRDLEALSDLLDALGHPRYARLVVSGDSRRVISEPDIDRSTELAEDLIAASGLEVPDTEDITWGHGPMNRPEDLVAHLEAALALETAVQEGRLHPGGARFAADSRRLVGDLMHSQDGGRLRAVGDARFGAWTGQLPTSLRRAALGVAEWLPLTALWNPHTRIRPLQWLLDEITAAGPDGITLASGGYLPPAMVRRAADTLAFPDLGPGITEREIELLQIGDLRQLARRLKLAGVQRGRLVLAPLGRRAARSQRLLYRLAVRELIPADDPDQAVAVETACLVAWTEDSNWGELIHRISAGMRERGRPSDDSVWDGVGGAAIRAVYRLQVSGALAYDAPRPRAPLALEDGGAEVMFAALRDRLLRFPAATLRE